MKKIWYKKYQYDSGHVTYYLTINDIQFGGPIFSKIELEKKLKEFE